MKLVELFKSDSTYILRIFYFHGRQNLSLSEFMQFVFTMQISFDIKKNYKIFETIKGVCF